MIYAFSRHIVVFFFLTETYLLSKFHHNFRSSPALRPPHPGQCASSWRSISATGMASGTSVWQGRSLWCWGRHLLVSLEPPQPGAGPPLEAARPNAWPCAYRHLSEWLRLEPLTVWDTVQWHRVDCLSMALGSCDWFSCQPWSVYIALIVYFTFPHSRGPSKDVLCGLTAPCWPGVGVPLPGVLGWHQRAHSPWRESVYWELLT